MEISVTFKNDSRAGKGGIRRNKLTDTNIRRQITSYDSNNIFTDSKNYSDTLISVRAVIRPKCLSMIFYSLEKISVSHDWSLQINSQGSNLLNFSPKGRFPIKKTLYFKI